MRLIRKIYWIVMVVLLVAGFPYEEPGEFITSFSEYVFFGLIFLYVAPKVLHIGTSAKRSGYRGGLRSSMIGSLQQGTSRAVTNFMMGNGGGSSNTRTNDAWARKEAADQRVRERTQALNDAKYHEYYAKKNAGSYDGYRSANRAQAARNKARNL